MINTTNKSNKESLQERLIWQQTNHLGCLVITIPNQHQFDESFNCLVWLSVVQVDLRSDHKTKSANEDGMHLGWPVPTVPMPTSPYLCQPYFNHSSLTIFPMHLIPMWAATLINIKSCAVTRSLTLNLLIWLLDHQKQFKVFLNSQKYQIVLLVVLSICEVTQGNVQILIYIFNCWTAQHFCVALYLGENAPQPWFDY